MRLVLFLLLTLTVRAAEVRVFAAASLTESLSEIAAIYERKSGDRIVFNFGASSMLARQIERGAPADLFLSADERSVNALGAFVVERTSVLSNTLVIVVPRKGGRAIRDPRALVNMRSIALAEPSSVPAGIYARTYLQSLGIWEKVRSRIVPTENVRGALAAAASGNVEAAIVYRTDARISKHVRVAYAVPRASGPPISYPFAVLRDAEEPGAARRFFAHLRSASARAVFVRHGFDVLR